MKNPIEDIADLDTYYDNESGGDCPAAPCSVSWISARDRLPTESDTDDFGEVYWCGKEYVCRITPQEIHTWDWSRSSNLDGHWAKTCIVRPSPPNDQGMAAPAKTADNQ